MKSKAIVFALVLTFIVSLFYSPTAHAATNHPVHAGETFYMQAEGVASGDTITIDNNAVVTIVGDPSITYSNVTITGQSVDLTIQDVKISNINICPIILKDSNNHLRLQGDNVLIHESGAAALNIAEMSHTTIYGPGSLYAMSENASAIGANLGEFAGTIVIKGGDITAETGNSNSHPCIGGEFSDIIIYDGTIHAKSRDVCYAPGIGSKAGSITIYDGNITAEGTKGAGIGGFTMMTSSPITIYGGNIVASSDSGAGIGGSELGSAGVIDIHDGIIQATSEQAAGIGGGLNCGFQNIHILGGTINTNGGFVDIGHCGSGSGSMRIENTAYVFLAHGTHSFVSNLDNNYRPLRLTDDGVPLSQDTVVTLHNPDFYVMNTTVHRDDGMLYAFLPFGDFNFTKDDGSKVTENFGIGGYALDILDLTFTDRPCPSTHQIIVQGTILNNEDEPYEDLDVTMCSTPRYDKNDAAGEFAFHDINLYDHSLFINHNGMPLDKFILTFTLGDSLSWTLDGHTLRITVTSDTSLVDITLKSQTEGGIDVVDVIGFSASQNPDTGDRG